MDEGNCRGLRRLLGGCVDEAAHGKVRLLLGCTDVADPWLSGNFEKAYQDIEKGCRLLLEKVTKNVYSTKQTNGFEARKEKI